MSGEHEKYGGVDSLAVAQQWLEATVRLGRTADCPCCGRPAGYEVRFEAAHARELRRLFNWCGEKVQEMEKRYGKELRMTDVACHVPTALGHDADSYSQDCLSAARHFEVVQSTRPGWWKLTPTGRDFILGRASLPRAAWVWKGERLFYIKGAGRAMVGDLL